MMTTLLVVTLYDQIMALQLEPIPFLVEHALRYLTALQYSTDVPCILLLSSAVSL